jgi:hypothetical protein
VFPWLPSGWARTIRAEQLLAELQRELPREHALQGKALEALADRDGASDDVLFRLVDSPDRFVIVHLTWRMQPETDPPYPLVAFEGTFDEFAAFDAERWGLEPDE